MSQKLAKRIRRKLREESERDSANSEGPLSPEILTQKQHSAASMKRLLMRRKDPMPDGKPNAYQGGAILHPLSERAQYQFAKKNRLGV